jgi:hypothetical protein
MKNYRNFSSQNRVIKIWVVNAFRIESECLTSSRLAA